jgi:hypothetical protein
LVIFFSRNLAANNLDEEDTSFQPSAISSPPVDLVVR